jgi:hypothetical protein
MPAPNSGPLALHPDFARNGPLIFWMWMPVVDRLDAFGKLKELSRGGFRLGVGTYFGEFHVAASWPRLC